MSERFFRFILGASLLLFLYLSLDVLVYAYIGVLIYEGITNWRIPILVSRIRYGKDYNLHEAGNITHGKLKFDAERALRLIVAAMLIGTFAVSHAPFMLLAEDPLWFFPWFVGFMLFMAGVTNICPMVMGLRWLGFR